MWQASAPCTGRFHGKRGKQLSVRRMKTGHRAQCLRWDGRAIHDVSRETNPAGAAPHSERSSRTAESRRRISRATNRGGRDARRRFRAPAVTAEARVRRGLTTTDDARPSSPSDLPAHARRMVSRGTGHRGSWTDRMTAQFTDKMNRFLCFP